jgi:hypothetical protein
MRTRRLGACQPRHRWWWGWRRTAPNKLDHERPRGFAALHRIVLAAQQGKKPRVK